MAGRKRKGKQKQTENNKGKVVRRDLPEEVIRSTNQNEAGPSSRSNESGPSNTRIPITNENMNFAINSWENDAVLEINIHNEMRRLDKHIMRRSTRRRNYERRNACDNLVDGFGRPVPAPEYEAFYHAPRVREDFEFLNLRESLAALPYNPDNLYHPNALGLTSDVRTVFRLNYQPRHVQADVAGEPIPLVPFDQLEENDFRRRPFDALTLIFQYMIRRLLLPRDLRSSNLRISVQLQGLTRLDDYDVMYDRFWFIPLEYSGNVAELDASFYCHLFLIFQNFVSLQNGFVQNMSIIILDEAHGGISTTKVEKHEIGGYLCMSFPGNQDNCLLTSVTRAMVLYRPHLGPSFEFIRSSIGIANGPIPISKIPIIADILKVNIRCYNETEYELANSGDKYQETVDVLLKDSHYFWRIKKLPPKQKCDKCGSSYRSKHTCNDKRASFYQKFIAQTRITNSLMERKEKAVKNKEEQTEFEDSEKFCVYFDMETWMDPNENIHVPYAIGWSFFNQQTNAQEYRVEYGEECTLNFVDFIMSLQDSSIFVAYNGSRFDFQILLRSLIRRGIPVSEVLFHSGRLLQANFGKKVTHKLFDLYLFTNCSLERACHEFGVNADLSKTLFPHRFMDSWDKLEYVGPVPKYEDFFFKPAVKITQSDRQKVDSIYPIGSEFNFRFCCLDYLQKDVEGMRDVTLKFGAMVKEKLEANLLEFMTLSQMAYRQWLLTLKDEINLVMQEKPYTEMREAYYGGRCYPVVRSYTSSQYQDIKDGKLSFDDVKDYIYDADVNSLYPYSMLNFPYPTGQYEYKEYPEDIYMMQKFEDNQLSIWYVHYVPNQNLMHPVLPTRTKGGLQWTLKSNFGWYTSVDLNIAWEQGYRIRLIKGYQWSQSAFIFQEYLAKSLSIKNEGTIEKNPVKRQIGKLLSNSLYGKFAQRPVKTTYQICRTQKDFNDFFTNNEWKGEWYLLDKDVIVMIGEITDIMDKVDKPHFIGAFITAYSRLVMYNYFKKTDPSLGQDLYKSVKSTFYYTDTDSMHLHSSVLETIQEDINDTEVGLLSNDLKNDGKVIKAVYVAPKLYYLEYIDNKDSQKNTVKSKGVNPSLISEEYFAIFEQDPTMTAKVDMGLRMKSAGLKSFQALTHYNVPLVRTLNKTQWKGRNLLEHEEQEVYFPWTDECIVE